MPGRVPRRMVCFVVFAASAAMAQTKHRPVAIIDLSGEGAAKQLRGNIYDTLLTHWALRPTTNTFDNALQGEFLDEDRPHLETARRHAQAAEDAVGQFDAKTARERARAGLDELMNAHPTAGMSLRADLAFALGIAELSARDKKAADRAFALAARLDPKREPDHDRYMDAIVKAYDAAKVAPAPRVKLEVRGTGHAWIDGVLVGAAPGTFEVAAGEHVVQLADADRFTRGQIVNAPNEIDIPPAPADPELQVRRARRDLANAPDATARAGVLKHLADLVGVRDVVLISKADDGALRTQTVTWKDGALAYSDWRAVDAAAASQEQLLEPLSGPQPVAIQPPPPKPVRPLPNPNDHHGETDRAWYRKKKVWAAILGGALASGAAIYLVVHQQHYVMPMPKTEFTQ
jgi:hypothetical protein